MSSFELLVVFILAGFVGYSIVWRITPALHSPLMAVTNAVSSIVIVGALMAFAHASVDVGWPYFCLLGALFCCMVNIVGGFWMTHRMLAMFRKTQKGGR
ncbi:MAG: NAD(P) transhydrogenase subunit alpha [Holosporaceae bacterium]